MTAYSWHYSDFLFVILWEIRLSLSLSLSLPLFDITTVGTGIWYIVIYPSIWRASYSLIPSFRWSLEFLSTGEWLARRPWWLVWWASRGTGGLAQVPVIWGVRTFRLVIPGANYHNSQENWVERFFFLIVTWKGIHGKSTNEIHRCISYRCCFFFSRRS